MSAADHSSLIASAAHRRARPALRARHGADGSGADAARPRARRPWARAARRRRAAVVPRARRRAGVDGPARPPGATCRGGRSAASTRSRATTAATSPRRAVGFGGFSLLAGWSGLVAGGWFRRHDAVIADVPAADDGHHRTARGVEPPRAARVQRAGHLPRRRRRDRRHHRTAGSSLPPRGSNGLSYRRADAVTVLSTDLADNVVGQAAPRPLSDGPHHPQLRRHGATAARRRMTPYRRELGIGDEPVLMYAGNVGYSQSLELLLEAARRLPGVTVLINGDGSAAPSSSGGGGPGQRALRRVRAAGSPRRGAGDRRRPRRAAAARPGPRQRAVEDVLDPRRRSARRRRHRSRHRRAPPPRRGRGRCHASLPTIPTPSWPPSTSLVDDPARATSWAGGGGRGSSGRPRRQPSPRRTSSLVVDLARRRRGG